MRRAPLRASSLAQETAEDCLISTTHSKPDRGRATLSGIARYQGARRRDAELSPHPCTRGNLLGSRTQLSGSEAPSCSLGQVKGPAAYALRLRQSGFLFISCSEQLKVKQFVEQSPTRQGITVRNRQPSPPTSCVHFVPCRALRPPSVGQV